MKSILNKLPNWTLSIITVLAILWLTLAPKPLGDEPPKLFPGADKVVHAIMFGGFTIVMLLDWQRKNQWKMVKTQRAFLSATVSAILGILIEIAQAQMGLGRGFEYADIIADTIGAYIFAILWLFLQDFWIADNP